MHYLFNTDVPILAIRFRDYVRYKYHEELIIQQVDTTLSVYVKQDSIHLMQLSKEVEEFMADPMNDRYEEASWQSGDNIPLTKLFADFKLTSLFKVTSLKQIKFSLFLTALCILVYIFEYFGFAEPILTFAHFPTATQYSELWRYLTHTLVHLSTAHIAFNLIWWWSFARAIETQKGSYFLIFLFVLSGLITGIAQNFMSGPNFFGLSGVVYAVLGYVYVADRFGKHNQFDLPQGFATMLFIGIGLGFLSPLIGIYMGNTAHITGLIIGGLLALKEITQCQKKFKK